MQISVSGMCGVVRLVRNLHGKRLPLEKRACSGKVASQTAYNEKEMPTVVSRTTSFLTQVAELDRSWGR